jgi:hypothetical protein
MAQPQVNHKQRDDASRIAASYLERGLGIVGALGHTMDVATFAAGRSRAIAMLNRWERDDLGYTPQDRP